MQKAPSETAPAAATEQNVEQLEAGICRDVLNNSNAIIQKLIEKAKNGEYLPAKFLFNLIGLNPAKRRDANGPEEESLAGLLLRELNIQDQPAPPQARMK